MRKFLVGSLLGLLLGGPLLAVQAEWTPGVVVKIDPARSKVTLRHAHIKSINMEAMTMPFKVQDGALLSGLKTGDKVRFTVAMKDDELLVTGIKAAK